MKKGWLIAGLIFIATITGCSQQIPVTVDADKEIQKEVQEIKKDLASVPISNVEGATRASLSIQTSIGKKDKMITMMGTDIIKYENQDVLVSYIVSNYERDKVKKTYRKPISKENQTYFTNEKGSSLYWQKNGWHLEMKPSGKIPVGTMIGWANTYHSNERIVQKVGEWFPLDDITFVKEIPGENVEFTIGLTAVNPNQTIVTKLSNALYTIIHTDIKEIKGYQINHSAVPVSDFNFEQVKGFKRFKTKDIKGWYHVEKKELYWQDGNFVYHLEGNPMKLPLSKDFFTLEDYKRFANIIQ